MGEPLREVLSNVIPTKMRQAIPPRRFEGVPARTTRKHHACEQYKTWLELQSETPQLKYVAAEN
jgi:hypothetical protein